MSNEHESKTDRDAFESYVRKECDSEEYANLILQQNSGGFYHGTRIQASWEGWKARGALSSKGWISVETALPDRHCLAVYQRESGRQHIIRAVHYKRFEVEAEGDDCFSEYNEEDDTEYLREGWYELVDNWGEYSSCHVCEGTVTHWQPLPPLPAKETSHVPT